MKVELQNITKVEIADKISIELLKRGYPKVNMTSEKEIISEEFIQQPVMFKKTNVKSWSISYEDYETPNGTAVDCFVSIGVACEYFDLGTNFIDLFRIHLRILDDNDVRVINIK